MNPEPNQDARRERLIKLGVAIGLAAVLAIVVLIVVSQSGSDSGDTDIESTAEVAELEGLDLAGATVGDPDAPVTVTEFGDLQCPICRQFSRQEIPSILDGPVADGEAKLEFRNWSILGKDSDTAAIAALAAGEQDKMWPFILVFYENQGPENTGYVTEEFLRGIAEEAGLDVAQWEQDRQNPAFAEELKQVDSEATEAGFDGTPSIQVSGPGGVFPLPGVPTAADIEQAIAEAQ
jgi:protein-disulfide isomerase